MSSVGSDEDISGAKIAPLDSQTKWHVPHADSHGVIGTEEVLDHARIEPLEEMSPTHHKQPLPHATTGVIGRDQTLMSSKIDPLAASASGLKTAGPAGEETRLGLDDEIVDGARVRPMGKTV